MFTWTSVLINLNIMTLIPSIASVTHNIHDILVHLIVNFRQNGKLLEYNHLNDKKLVKAYIDMVPHSRLKIISQLEQ